jgi:PLAT/LH2 domain
MNTKIKLAGLAVCIAGCVATAGPARAFDTGPHADMTRDALAAEGFGNTAIQITQVNNWLVDMGEQAHKNLKFSNAAWNSAILIAADRSHFDNTDKNGNPGEGFKNTAELTAEWDRLRTRVHDLARAARDANNPLRLLTVLGISLHQVQDFYTHTNWVEPSSSDAGAIIGADGPGWLKKGWGNVPTWFDVSSAARNQENLYSHSSGNGPHRSHGDWNSDNNLSLGHLSKDWPGRPMYREAYMAAYFATRQWVQAVRSWVADEAFWGRMRAYSDRLGGDLDHEQHYMRTISVASGHWQGQGDPAGGDAPGDGGRIVDLLGELAGYVAYGLSGIQLEWGRMITQVAAPVNPVLVPKGIAIVQAVSVFGGSSLPAVPSSQPLQASHRFVSFQVDKIEEIDDMDLGTIDEADYYVKTNIGGQDFRSGNIFGHDNYYFSRPNYPFTFLKALPVNASFSEPLYSLRVEVATSTDSWSGTDDNVYLRINNGTRFQLDKPLYNDFENGDRDVYSCPVDGPRFTLGDIDYLQIEKSPDGIAGGWKLRGVKVWANGVLIYSNDAINKWLEDDHRTWRAPSFAALAPKTVTEVPTWVALYDEDSILRGDDDHCDLHPDHDRKNLGLLFNPVSGYYRGDYAGFIGGTVQGGDNYGGRVDALTGDGNRARMHFLFGTLTPSPATAGHTPDSSGLPTLFQATPGLSLAR